MIAKPIVKIVLYAIGLNSMAFRLHPLGVPEYPWEIVGIYYVTDSPRSGAYGYTSVLIMVCHLTKMAHFVPCHKVITAEE